MAIRFDYNNVLDSRVGRQHGLSLRSIRALQKRTRIIHDDLRQRRESGELGFFDLPYDLALAKRVRELAQKLRARFSNFVLLGIGGSALGPSCLHTALRHYYYNSSKKAREGGPRMIFLDNADPELMAGVLDTCALKNTVFNVISKSGATPETMSQFMVFFDAVGRKLGKKALKRHFVATTDDESGFLRRIVDEYQLESLPVPGNVGGRFSVMTAVGLLPAAVSGIDIRQLLKGGARMDKVCSRTDLMSNPAYLNAAIHYLLDVRRGKSISVMMPYANALKDVADWYRQLWAESLGKRFDLHGNEVFVGQTPVKALGATDQHSQVQLYLEGPNDKVFNLIEVEKFRRKCPVPRSLSSLPELDFLTGADMAKLLNAELAATEFALTQGQRPNVRFTLDAITPQNVGGLLYLLEVQTAFAGGLYGINPFDQPGVELGKKATAALMGRGKPEDQAKLREVTKHQKSRKMKPLEA
jgi:glucose-6-phosphate isomerase